MLSGWEYIISKQIQWANNKNIHLIGSKGDKGRAAYTYSLEQNLIDPLLKENEDRFRHGDGHEISGSIESPAKMQAVHSSSALGVNLFQYWQNRGLINEIASACGFCDQRSKYSERIVFEVKFKIDKIPGNPPNIDVIFCNNDTSPHKLFAVECKFSEAYGGRAHGGLKKTYLEHENLWIDISALQELAWEMNRDDKRYTYLDAGQLIKHILGLKTCVGTKGFKLLYLWYDVLGTEGAIHRSEVEDFTKTAKSDGINFHAMTYQELITILDRRFRTEHFRYIKYLTERYN